MSSSRSQKSLSNLDLVAACDNFPYDEPIETLDYYSLHLPNDASPHGYITPANLALFPWHASPAFKINHETRQVTLTLSDSSSSFSSNNGTLAADAVGAACTAAFAAVVNAAIEADTFGILDGQHSEMYRIIGARHAVAVERFAAPLFGITTRGVHLTVYTYLNNSARSTTSGREEFSNMRIWVPRRSLTLWTHPGKLDSTVAGGAAAHETPLETLVHEADEEASLPPELIKSRVRSGGALTYMQVAEPTLQSASAVASGKRKIAREGYVCGDCMYVYDLELSAHEAETVKLVPKDGEVKEFMLMCVEEVKMAMAKGEFKPNSALVMLDFFIRHGILTPNDEPAYVEILTRLHRRLPFPLTDHGCIYPAPS